MLLDERAFMRINSSVSVHCRAARSKRNYASVIPYTAEPEPGKHELVELEPIARHNPSKGCLTSGGPEAQPAEG